MAKHTVTAAATAEEYVLVALIAAGQISGVAMLIASPLGIVLVGAGVAYFTWRLRTHGHGRL